MKLKDKLSESPINYFSDLFICAMVILWIADNVYEAVIASAVTISSIVLSFSTGYACFDTSMWSSIGSNVAIPLSCGGALWMLKNGVQHAIAYRQGKRAHMDFPAVHPDGEGDEIEIFTEAAETEEQPQETEESAVDYPDESNIPDEAAEAEKG